jgi:hypothetical protein
MRIASFICAVAVGVAGASGGTSEAAAQSRRVDEYGNPRPRAPARIVVTPNRRLVRECDAWYALEHRVAGTVLTPQMRCWWTYR